MSHEGVTGMTVKQQQLLLIYLGYDPGELDGIPGPNTERATKKFQKDYGLEADGICGAQTQKMLTAAVAGIAEPVSTDTNVGGNTDWWKDIRYFTRTEFKCKCGGRFCNGYPVEIDMNMVKIADKIREKIGKPITVNSGLRCKTHNANVGGVSNSQHLLGNAADLGCPIGCTPAQMAAIAEEIMGDTGGIGIYSWGIHIDTRSAKSRWNG